MDSLISQEQYAFLKGGHLLDSVIPLNEVLDLVRVFKREC